MCNRCLLTALFAEVLAAAFAQEEGKRDKGPTTIDCIVH